MKKWILAAALIAVVGCINPRIVDLNNGSFCSAENVRAYAKKRHMTYEQALEALRQESDQLWAEQEVAQAKKAGQAPPKATVVPEVSTKAAKP